MHTQVPSNNHSAMILQEHLRRARALAHRTSRQFFAVRGTGEGSGKLQERSSVQAVNPSKELLFKGIQYEWRQGCINTKGARFSTFGEFLLVCLKDPLIMKGVASSTVTELTNTAENYTLLSIDRRRSLLQQIKQAMSEVVLKQRESPSFVQAASSAVLEAAVIEKFATRDITEQLGKPFQPPSWSKAVPIFIDLETSGMSHQKDHIVEIAAKSLSSAKEFEARVRLPPGTFMSTKAAEITGFTTAMCSDPSLPTFKKAYMSFLEFIDAELEISGNGSIPVFVGHNVQSFDLKMLLAKAIDDKLPLLFEAKILDTLHLARHVHLSVPGQGTHKLQALFKRYKGHEPQTQHRALADIHTNIEVFNHLLRERKWEGLPFEELLMKAQTFSSSVEWVADLASPVKAASKSRSAVLSLSGFRALGFEETSTMVLNEGEHQSEYTDEDFSVEAWAQDDPLAVLESEAREADAGAPLPFLGGTSGWQGVLSSENVPQNLLATKLSDIKGSVKYTPKQLKTLDAAGFKMLQDVLECYPKGFIVSTPGKLPSINIEEQQAIALIARFDNATAQVFKSGGAGLRATFKVVPPWVAELDVPHLAADTYSGRQSTTLVVSKFRKKGWGANYLHVEARKMREEYGSTGDPFLIVGRVQRSEFPPDTDCWELKESTYEIHPLDAKSRELFNRGGKHVSSVYAARGNVSSKEITTLVSRGLQLLEVYTQKWTDPLPLWVRERYNLSGMLEALKGMHAPLDSKDFERARQRMAFQELVALQLKLLLQRTVLRGANGLEQNAIRISNYSLIELAKKGLPFSLTGAQRRVLAEILEDMSNWPPMMCLLQGDVGCGKTIVAFLSLLAAAGSGYQGAIMAPTEILAEQHYKGLQQLLSSILPEKAVTVPVVALVTGSQTPRERASIAAGLAAGSIHIAVGTHALISSSTEFKSLGLVVIDEQHKFGVEQRAALLSKNSPAPHVLSMSATPIPRSKALVLHGEMTQLVINELPPGRLPITTRLLVDSDSTREELYTAIRSEISTGGRVYIVCPLVEGSKAAGMDDLKAAVSEKERLVNDGILSEQECGLLHGRMSAEEKESAIAAFASGETHALISTTVVEVGVDVPEASLIVVEHADRFGLAQLHQLRGRVGRGNRPSSCYLMADRGKDVERLRILEATSNGFEVAEEDFRLRGAGEILGIRQSGKDATSSLKACKLPEDLALLEKAREAAALFMEKHPEGPVSWPKEMLWLVRNPNLLSLDLAELPSLSD